MFLVGQYFKWKNCSKESVAENIPNTVQINPLQNIDFQASLKAISLFPDRELKFPEPGNFLSGPENSGIGKPEYANPNTQDYECTFQRKYPVAYSTG